MNNDDKNFYINFVTVTKAGCLGLQVGVQDWMLIPDTIHYLRDPANILTSAHYSHGRMLSPNQPPRLSYSENNNDYTDSNDNNKVYKSKNKALTSPHLQVTLHNNGHLGGAECGQCC